MHPFLPVLSLVLLAMGDSAAFLLWKNGRQLEIAVHRPSLLALIFVSLLFGGVLAFWLRRFRLNFPAYFACISVIWVILLALLKKGG